VVAALVWVGGVIWLGLAEVDQVAEFNSELRDTWRQWVGVGKASFMDRLCIWKSGSEMLLGSPLIGIGWAQFPLIYPLHTLEAYYNLWGPVKLITTEEAHSGHFNIALETGLLGGGAWAAVLALAWIGALRNLRLAAQGDMAARATLIWFPPAAALVLHMWIDKFLSYPASMILMMWCLGQMVRPRQVARGGEPSARWVGAVGLIALAAALLTAVLPISLAMGSSGLAAGRAGHQRGRDFLAASQTATNPARQSAMRQQGLAELERAGQALESARRLLPWEIDGWTRSIDLASISNIPELGGPDPDVYLWHRGAVRSAPNYYPILANMGNRMLLEYRRLRSADPERAQSCRDLAFRLFEQVRRLRPNELRALLGQGELLADSGDWEGFEDRYERYLAIGNVDQHDKQRANAVRMRLARHHRGRGEAERALALFQDAEARAPGVRKFDLWLQIADCQVALGRPGDAWQELGERMETIDEARVGEVLTAHERRGRRIRSAQEAWQLTVAYLALDQGSDAANVLMALPTTQSDPEAWVLATVVARVAGEDLCRDLLASGEARWPGHQVLATASSELLGR
jgi:tetratricopeptide (TPR) repeat protein